jgi:transposase
VLETGALSAFLYHGLTLRDLPVVCICAARQRRPVGAR